jgi:uncharacterized membrane protein YeiH
MKYDMKTLVFAADILGTFVFAAEGASTALRANLDLIGILTLAFVTALGGGIIRDVLLGATPPASIRDWHYAATALLGGAIVFLFHRDVQTVAPQVILILDAAGLGLFAVAGAGKALEFGVHPLIAVLMGGVTGVGGGTIRDVLLAQVPRVPRVEVYATAALFGAAVMVLGIRLKGNRAAMAVVGGASCFVLRMISVWQHWSLPAPK